MIESGYVWITGSYPDEKSTSGELAYTKRLTRLLASRIAQADITAMMGESDMLADFCSHYRSALSLDSLARAIMIHGSLRHPDTGEILRTYFNSLPTVMLIIGGGEHGRTAEEAKSAADLGIRIGGFPRTGGVSWSATFLNSAWSNDDASVAAHQCLHWIETSLST